MKVVNLSTPQETHRERRHTAALTDLSCYVSLSDLTARMTENAMTLILWVRLIALLPHGHVHDACDPPSLIVERLPRNANLDLVFIH